MDNLLLAKNDVPDGWIDVRIGEPIVIRNNLEKLFNIHDLNISKYSVFEYSKPQGYDPLVKFLEDKYQKNVVVANGAKQCIGALFYALKKLGTKNIYMDTPWWSLFPPLINMHGLQHANLPHTTDTAYLLVSPQNPSGSVASEEHVESFINQYVVHDAVYNNNIYLSRQHKIKFYGDAQVFTCSKLLGLSQLRLGFITTNNTDLRKYVLEYLENMTVGVSVLSQIFALNIFEEMKQKPDLLCQFEDYCFNAISRNRKLVNNISSSVLVVDYEQSGMFLWAKYNNIKAFDDAKILVAEGTPFGMPGYIRMNLALPEKTMIEVVDRLNH